MVMLAKRSRLDFQMTRELLKRAIGVPRMGLHFGGTKVSKSSNMKGPEILPVLFHARTWRSEHVEWDERQSFYNVTSLIEGIAAHWNQLMYTTLREIRRV